MTKPHDPETTARLLARIKEGQRDNLPTLTDMQFVRFCEDGKHWDAAHTWAVYVSHDPCHDTDRKTKHGRITYRADRNTVVAFHRRNGTYRIIGRELDMRLAKRIALGLA
jgi:hypothetical protein